MTLPDYVMVIEKNDESLIIKNIPDMETGRRISIDSKDILFFYDWDWDGHPQFIIIGKNDNLIRTSGSEGVRIRAEFENEKNFFSPEGNDTFNLDNIESVFKGLRAKDFVTFVGDKVYSNNDWEIFESLSTKLAEYKEEQCLG